jgi:CheY-like chemotaxis protein
MNLCGNASDAMRESGGRLDITLDRITIEPEAYATELENLSPGPYARLTVQDTGPGMDQATLDRIFDPFFTTKKTGQGTGMGLSVVHGIVAGHKGIVRAHSRPGQGARFEVLLPLIDVSAAQNLPQPDLPAGGSERILFVDDESALVQIGVQMLKRLGYHVVGLTSSAEALQLFQNDPDRFDLLVTDQTMPDLTGDALAREIFEIRPDLPVIVCSGFNQESESNPMANIRRHLVKPLAADELARSVREELDARTNSSA